MKLRRTGALQSDTGRGRSDWLAAGTGGHFGSRLWVRVNSPDFGESPKPSGPEDFFQELADGAPVMIWMAGLDMGCFYFNQAWLDFCGRTLAQEQGNGWAEGVHPEDLERCVRHYVGCFEQRIAFAMSYRLKHHSGQYRWILDRGAPHFLPDGTFLGFYGGCAQTERDSAIERIAQLRDSLQSLQKFAQRIAGEEAAVLHAFKGPRETASLQAFAREHREAHVERVRRKQLAAVEMGRLAGDMLTYGKIEHGECLT